MSGWAPWGVWSVTACQSPHRLETDPGSDLCIVATEPLTTGTGDTRYVRCVSVTECEQATYI